MDISIYFSPVQYNKDEYYKEQVGGLIECYTEQSGFPEWEEAELLIVGVKEERGAFENEGCSAGADKVREQLYKLYFEQMPKVVDLGNILPGETMEDTYHAIKSVVDQSVKKEKTIIFIGGSQDLTIPMYKGYENTEQLVNLTTIDPKFDIGSETDSPINSETYLSQILLHQPNFLFNYSNIGYQTYFASPDIIGLMDKLFFDKMRLGEVRKNIREAEPIIRNTDILSFDVSSIQGADMQGCNNATPNGLLPDEACQLTRYAGLSEKISCFGIFEYNPRLDVNNNSAILVAQMIWYFIEGFKNRKGEVPKASDTKFLRYLVPVSGTDQDVVFYKSISTDRWWMLVPYPDEKSSRYRRLNMVPCSYYDYLAAGQDDLPDLWLKTYRKFL